MLEQYVSYINVKMEANINNEKSTVFKPYGLMGPTH